MQAIRLTARQQSIVQFMREHLVQFQRLPTIREIAVAFAIRSPNGVAGHLRALSARGAITRGETPHAINYRLNGVVLRLESVRDFASPLEAALDPELSRRSAAPSFEKSGEFAGPAEAMVCTAG